MLNSHLNHTKAVKIKGKEIESIKEYIYLGKLITPDGKGNEEVRRRITLGWKAFGRANLLLRSKKLPILHKRKFLDQCITPTITYGAETWALNRKLAIKLRNTQRAMERTMLNISLKEHQTAESIRQKTKVKDILETIGKMKWRWGGHIMRRNDERWTKRITD